MNLEQQVWGFGRVECPPFEVKCGYQLPGVAGLGMYAGWNDGFDVPSGMNWDIIEPCPIEIMPFKPGMPVEGGWNIYGNKSTAILYDPYTELNIHHHNLGGGALVFDEPAFGGLPGDKYIDILPWK